ncbi:uncharacterized protein LOC117896927 [Drosophila subobscura]|uniref:uncharacterized protein LOC117896927 n=1 Tax=Drosophila subobscura TaxID=7241 RepID=UPI00155A92ED|nr:uncharacterized protein LOC117896927 [Drosophila subobscura]
MEPNVVEKPLPDALSGKRYSKKTEDSWRAAQAELLRADKKLKLKEKNVEVLLAKSFASTDAQDNILMNTKPSTLKKTKKTKKTTKKTKSSGLKLSHSQEQILIAQVIHQMRLLRHKSAIIDMGLVLLTTTLVSCACLWGKTAFLLCGFLLLGPLIWSIGLGTCGRRMGIKVVRVVLSLAAAIAVAEFCPYLEINLISALSGISVASAIMRSASGAVGRAILWGFLLPIITFANLLWIPDTGSWNWNNYCTKKTFSIILADMIFMLLTILVIRSEIISKRDKVSFLNDEEMHIVRTDTLKYHHDRYADWNDIPKMKF